MKTWICQIYGAGTPCYLIAANNEINAWKLLVEEMTMAGYHTYNLADNSTGLVEIPDWESAEEGIVDIYETYAPNGILKKGWTM